MFARVVRYTVDPDRCDEALEAFEEAAKTIGDIDGITRRLRDGRRRRGTHRHDDDLGRPGEDGSERGAREPFAPGGLRTVEGDIDSVERLRIAAGSRATLIAREVVRAAPPKELDGAG